MNSLSITILLIAWAEAISSFLSPLIIFTFAIAFLSFLTLTIGYLAKSFEHADSPAVEGWNRSMEPHLWQAFLGSFAIWVVTSFIWLAIPQKQYMIMIAASEIAEMVAQTDAAQQIAKDVSGLSAESAELLRNYIQLETARIKEQLAEKAHNNTGK